MKKYFLPLCLLVCLHTQSQTFYNFDQAKLIAQSTGKLILIDFNATWCGPCRQMDADFWDNDDYNAVKEKFVIAKIDIDQYRSLAVSYNIKSIPNIKVVDILGEELMGFEGYVNGKEMEKSLEGFPASTGNLYEAMEFENENKPSAEECLFVAASYQTVAQTVSGEPKTAFIRQSNTYYSRCKKNHPTDTLSQKADIGKAFNYVLTNAPQKAIKSIVIEKTYDENKPFALYIIARAYTDLNDRANAQTYLAQLEGLHQDQWATPIAALRKKLE